MIVKKPKLLYTFWRDTRFIVLYYMLGLLPKEGLTELEQVFW